MADQINDGGAAFPIPNDDRPGAYPAEPGMSLRDWFAGQALAGFMANCDTAGSNGWLGILDVSARNAYVVADAMIAARKGGAQ